MKIRLWRIITFSVLSVVGIGFLLFLIYHKTFGISDRYIRAGHPDSSDWIIIANNEYRMSLSGFVSSGRVVYVGSWQYALYDNDDIFSSIPYRVLLGTGGLSLGEGDEWRRDWLYVDGYLQH